MSGVYGDEVDVFGKCDECIRLEDDRDELRAEIDRQDALLLAGKESQERCAEASLGDSMTIVSQEEEIKRLREINDRQSVLVSAEADLGEANERLRALEAQVRALSCPFRGLIGPLEHEANGCCS